MNPIAPHESVAALPARKVAREFPIVSECPKIRPEPANLRI
jgi:hypothetical protein